MILFLVFSLLLYYTLPEISPSKIEAVLFWSAILSVTVDNLRSERSRNVRDFFHKFVCYFCSTCVGCSVLYGYLLPFSDSTYGNFLDLILLLNFYVTYPLAALLAAIDLIIPFTNSESKTQNQSFLFVVYFSLSTIQIHSGPGAL